MKRRKRMGMSRVPAISPGAAVDTAAAPHAHGVAEAPAMQLHESMQPAFESTPEKFVAFVNRMTEARSTSR